MKKVSSKKVLRNNEGLAKTKIIIKPKNTA